MDASVEKKLDEKKKLFMDVIRGKKPARRVLGKKHRLLAAGIGPDGQGQGV